MANYKPDQKPNVDIVSWQIVLNNIKSLMLKLSHGNGERDEKPNFENISWEL